VKLRADQQVAATRKLVASPFPKTRKFWGEVHGLVSRLGKFEKERLCFMEKKKCMNIFKGGGGNDSSKGLNYRGDRRSKGDGSKRQRDRLVGKRMWGGVTLRDGKVVERC